MIIAAIYTAASLGSIAIDTECTGRFATYGAGPTVATEQEIMKTVKDQFTRETDLKLAKDKESREHAAVFNKKIAPKTIEVATIDGIKVKATLAQNYYSLSEPYIGKTFGIIWQDKGKLAFPLYSISSCHYAKPDLKIIKAAHGTYLFDDSLTSISGVGKATIVWKVDDGSIVRTNIDNALEAEALKISKEKKIESIALGSGFDIQTLTYKGKTRTKDDCAACYTGPEVTIKLIPEKDGYKAQSSF